MPGPQQRRRGAELEASLLDATWDELAEVGYHRLTMENVAQRANTGKQVLYRRWPNRAALVIATIRSRVGTISQEIPDTGSLRADVITLLYRMYARQRELGPDVVRGLMAEIPDLRPDDLAIMPDVMTAILRHAAERGELDLSKLTPRVIALPVDLLRHEILTTGAEVPESSIAGIVDEVFLPVVWAASRA